MRKLQKHKKFSQTKHARLTIRQTSKRYNKKWGQHDKFCDEIMAKYTITFSCGHTETVQLYGSIASREDYIKWASKHGQCHACKDAEKAAERTEVHKNAVANVQKYDLPALVGSDKQISWAIDIRQKMIEEIEMACKGHSLEEMKEKWQSITEEQKEKMLNAEKDTYAYKLSHIFVETSAKFYIENR